MTGNNIITKEMIARINELAHLSKQRQLTASELKEQAELRRQYVNAIKAQVTAKLDNLTIINPDGTTARPRRKDEVGVDFVRKYAHECGCGHAHQHDDHCGCGNHEHNHDHNQDHEGCSCGCDEHCSHVSDSGNPKNNGGYGKH